MKIKTSSKIENIGQLISYCYDAALVQEKWGTFIKELNKTVYAEQAFLRIINSSLQNLEQTYSHNKDPYWDQLYKEHYIQKDFWINEIGKAKKTLIGCTHHLITDREYEKREFHSEFVSPQGTHYSMGGKIYINDNYFGYLSLNRDRNKQGFEDENLELLQQLTPHIQKALLINNRTLDLELKESLLRDALNQLNSPLLLVNKFGKVLFINKLAENIVEQYTGIHIKNGQIYLQQQSDNKKLQQLIQQATGKTQQGNSMHYKYPGTHASLSILISPINPDMVNNDTQNSKSALLLLSTHYTHQSFSAELVSSLYNLTPAEARLTIELCNGLTLNEIAQKFSLSKNTLRSQLRSCFSKTEVSRQVELVTLVNEGPAGQLKKI